MDKIKIIGIIAYYCGGTHENLNKSTEEILELFKESNKELVKEIKDIIIPLENNSQFIYNDIIKKLYNLLNKLK